jgi:hypothetical protein
MHVFGAVAVIAKPISGEDLVAQVRKKLPGGNQISG